MIVVHGMHQNVSARNPIVSKKLSLAGLWKSLSVTITYLIPIYPVSRKTKGALNRNLCQHIHFSVPAYECEIRKYFQAL